MKMRANGQSRRANGNPDGTERFTTEPVAASSTAEPSCGALISFDFDMSGVAWECTREAGHEGGHQCEDGGWTDDAPGSSCPPGAHPTSECGSVGRPPEGAQRPEAPREPPPSPLLLAQLGGSIEAAKMAVAGSYELALRLGQVDEAEALEAMAGALFDLARVVARKARDVETEDIGALLEALRQSRHAGGAH